MHAITDSYSVAPQIEPGDLPALKDAGITTIICNRPDEEVPPGLQAADLRAAAEAAGMSFHVVPVTHQGMTLDTVAAHGAALAAADGPVLAYCRSGTRSAMIWALTTAQSGAMTPDEIIAAVASAGYDASGLAPTLNELAARAGG